MQSAEFRHIYQAGIRMTSRYFAAFCLRSTGSIAGEDGISGGQAARFGFTVPRAIGKAVVRNRVKRRMREAVRAHLNHLPARCAIVFNPRRNVLDVPFDELCREIGRVLGRCSEL